MVCNLSKTVHDVPGRESTCAHSFKAPQVSMDLEQLRSLRPPNGVLKSCLLVYLYSIIQQILANDFGSGPLLRPLWARAFLKQWKHGRTPVQQGHRGHSSGSPWAGMKPDALKIMRMELNATPHGNLGTNSPKKWEDPGGLTKGK